MSYTSLFLISTTIQWIGKHTMCPSFCNWLVDLLIYLVISGLRPRIHTHATINKEWWLWTHARTHVRTHAHTHARTHTHTHTHLYNEGIWVFPLHYSSIWHIIKKWWVLHRTVLKYQPLEAWLLAKTTLFLVLQHKTFCK